MQKHPDVMLGDTQLLQGACCVRPPCGCFESWGPSIVYVHALGGEAFFPQTEVWFCKRKGNCLVAGGRINSCEATHAGRRTPLSAVSPLGAPVGPDPTQIWCSHFDVYEPIAFKCRIMIQGLEKLLFIQTWLTPHHFQLAVLIMLIVLFVFGFFCPNLQSELALAGCGCVLA